MSKGKLKQAIFSTTADDWKFWAQQYSKETDRGLAIISSAMLDHLLSSLIEKFLVDDQKATKELLCNSMSPLGTFAARIAIACSMGLISYDERDDLNIIREIRNKFAHKAIGLTFESEQISKFINKLKIPKLLTIYGIKRQNNTNRSTFIDAASMISTFIEKRREMLSERRTPAEKFIFQKT